MGLLFQNSWLEQPAEQHFQRGWEKLLFKFLSEAVDSAVKTGEMPLRTKCLNFRVTLSAIEVPNLKQDSSLGCGFKGEDLCVLDWLLFIPDTNRRISIPEET